jgi:hypothetical protein
VYGAGAQAGVYAPDATPGTTHVYSSSTQFNFTLAGSANLMVGLLGQQSLGAGFDLLKFVIDRNGSVVFSQTFSTLADAQGFFSDHALSLGSYAGLQELTLSAELTASGAGGFGFGYVVGTGSPVVAVPEPATWLLLLLGCTVILVRCRSNDTVAPFDNEETTA